MNRLAIGITLALVTSGTGAQPYEGKDTAYYIGCLREQAAVLDDRVSDARSIAVAIVTTCRARRREFLIETNPTSLVIGVLARPASPGDIDNGTTVVLQERATRKR